MKNRYANVANSRSAVAMAMLHIAAGLWRCVAEAEILGALRKTNKVLKFAPVHFNGQMKQFRGSQTAEPNNWARPRLYVSTLCHAPLQQTSIPPAPLLYSTTRHMQIKRAFNNLRCIHLGAAMQRPIKSLNQTFLVACQRCCCRNTLKAMATG